jgi:hypothetical protein
MLKRISSVIGAAVIACGVLAGCAGKQYTADLQPVTYSELPYTNTPPWWVTDTNWVPPHTGTNK